MSGRLEGKIALITGGSTGIGLATARVFVEEGAFVYITGRRQPELDAAVASIGSNVAAIQGDVSKLADLDRMYERISREKGRLDIVFANAGGGPLVPLGAITEEHFDAVFDVNVKGMVFTVQKALPLIPNGGTVLLTGSIVDIKGFPAFSIYSATKAAVRSLARTWTTDLKDRGIRVNVISPGPIDTPLLNDAFANPDNMKALASTVVMGRLGGRRKSRRRRSSSPPTMPASLPAPSCSSTAARRRCDGDAHPSHRADAVRRGQRHPLRLSPVRQGRRCSAGPQPALHGDHGLLGSGRNRRPGCGPRSHSVRQRRRRRQLRRGACQLRGDGRQRDRLHQGARLFQGRRLGLFHRRHGRPGDHSAGARTRAPSDPGRHRSARCGLVHQQVERRSLRAPTIRRSTSGSRFFSRRPPQAKPPASPSWSASFGARTAIRRSARKPPWRSARRSANTPPTAMASWTI